jgi:acyl-coenzyme A synthetase/AMP-(fatty) acid ligase
LSVVNPFRDFADDRPLCHGARELTRGQLLREAAALAGRLPERARLVNLCVSRPAFLTTFVASMLRRQPQLLPGQRSAEQLAELDAIYGSTHAITDQDVRRTPSERAGESSELEHFTIAADDLVLTGFTSGSTGISQPHDKRWAALCASCRDNGAAIRTALGISASEPVSLLGTVPAHHMYGLELTVLLPLFGGMSVHEGRPLFPADVAAALATLPQPRVLVSTPLHLRALADSDLEFPGMSLIVSASAPLEAELAARVEARLRAPLLEMFGSTETFVFATRRTVHETEWRLYDGVQILDDPGGTRVRAPWYLADQPLHDVLEPRGERRFVLRGRSSDLVEVAGKRASLADISRRLCAIPGVADAVVFQPDTVAGAANRLAAAVVCSGITERQIVAALGAGLDPAFIPRPLLFVDEIPRDALGKVSRDALARMLSPR